MPFISGTVWWLCKHLTGYEAYRFKSLPSPRHFSFLSVLPQERPTWPSCSAPWCAFSPSSRALEHDQVTPLCSQTLQCGLGSWFHDTAQVYSFLPEHCPAPPKSLMTLTGNPCAVPGLSLGICCSLCFAWLTLRLPDATQLLQPALAWGLLNHVHYRPSLCTTSHSVGTQWPERPTYIQYQLY